MKSNLTRPEEERLDQVIKIPALLSLVSRMRYLWLVSVVLANFKDVLWQNVIRVDRRSASVSTRALQHKREVGTMARMRRRKIS